MSDNTQMVQDNLDNSIIQSNPSSDVSDLVSDIAEALLDQSLEDGILRDLPVWGDLVKIIKVGGKIRDYIFERKLGKFLFYLDKVKRLDRHNFSQKLSEDLNYRHKVGEYLLLIIDRLNDLDKPELLAKVFKVYVEGQIDFTQFKRLGSAIDIAFIEDLKSIIKTDLNQNEQKILFENLVSSGLTKINPTAYVNKPAQQNTPFTKMTRPPNMGGFFGDKEPQDEARINYVLSSLGELYIKIMKEEI